jgi:hypothetical protein
VTAADFNHDGFPDVAVMNRASADVNILLTYPGNVGFTAVDHVYLVEGEVVGLSVYDFNHDGRDDVIQLHRASGNSASDWPVRTAPSRRRNTTPSDKCPVPSDRGREQRRAAGPGHGQSRGGRSGFGFCVGPAGLNDGAFGPEQRFYLSNATEQIAGRLFALVAGDFDSPPDGNIDLAAGFLDNRIAFFQGNGNGTFSYTRSHEFLQEARALVAGDFDHDGDPILRASGSDRNWRDREHGDLLTTTHLSTTTYPPPSFATFGARALKMGTWMATTISIWCWGAAAARWCIAGVQASVSNCSRTRCRSGVSVSSVATADLDHDGLDELVLACRVLDCVTIFTRTRKAMRRRSRWTCLRATSSRPGISTATEQADLIGSGRLLWTALSSRAPAVVPPLRRTGNRGQLAHPVINEFLASTRAAPWNSMRGGSQIGSKSSTVRTGHFPRRFGRCARSGARRKERSRRISSTSPPPRRCFADPTCW